MNRGERRKLWIYGPAALIVAAALIYVTVRFAPWFLSVLKDRDAFRSWVLGFGKLGMAAFIGMQIAQIVISVIPGEVVQIAGGYIYGTWQGTLLLMLGAAAGEAAVFFLTRLVGNPLVKVFVSKKNYDKFSFLMNSEKAEAAMFMLFLIPGIPKDVLTYVAGVTPMKAPVFFTLSLVGRFPAMLASAYAGAHLQKGDYALVAVLGVIAALLLGAGIFFKDRITGFISRKMHNDRRDMTMADKNMLKMRKIAAAKKRRLIYNDDGDARRIAEACVNKESFLAERFNQVLDSQVDSYFWCVGNGMRPSFGVPDPEGIGDADQVILDACRANGLEAFATLRMNDTHDSVFKQYLPQLKKDRPDLLVAEDKNYPRDSILFLTWSAFDYAHDEVRKLRLDFIRYTCETYDWDGIELDYCRFRRYFKVGEEAAGAPLMTAFIGDVRAILDEIGAKRGRPILLSVRVPETIHYANRLGLEIEKWIEAGHIDILIAGDGLKPYSQPLEELIALGRKNGLPVYSCVSLAQFEDDNTGDPRVSPRLRAAVSNRWLEKPDGIYIFNLCCMLNGRNPALADELRPLVGVLGDLATLAGTNKIFESEAIPHWADWQINNTPNIFPVRLIDDAPLPLVVGDDVSKSASLTLGVRISGILDEENITVSLNGAPVEITERRVEEGKKIGVFDHSGGTWFEACVKPGQIRRGMNTVRAFVGIGSWGRLSTLVQEVRLEVKYP